MVAKSNHQNFALGYSHPSSLILVDDHAGFLRDMEMSVPTDLLYKSFEDPRVALNWINDFSGEQKNLLRQALSYHGQSGEKVLLGCDLGLLEDGIMDTNRFNLPTVLITDYMMPGMNGLELSAAINDQQVKKILLTGKAEENTGIDAFNSGLIDGFVMKSRPDAADAVFKLAAGLQREYFTGLQNPILGGSGMAKNFFDDASAIARIEEIVANGDYVEHYLTSNPLGYVVLTATGELGRIGVFDDNAMKDQLSLAKSTNAPRQILEKLESRSHAAMSYLMEPTSYQTDDYPWSEVICPCEKLYGTQDWWIAVDDNGPAPADYDPAVGSFNAKLYG